MKREYTKNILAYFHNLCHSHDRSELTGYRSTADAEEPVNSLSTADVEEPVNGLLCVWLPLCSVLNW